MRRLMKFRRLMKIRRLMEMRRLMEIRGSFAMCRHVRETKERRIKIKTNFIKKKNKKKTSSL